MYNVLISSITYFLAFVWPEYLGWLGLVSLWILAQEKLDSLARACLLGFVWGIFFFSAQFLWILVLLQRHSHAPLGMQIGLWLLFIVYMTIFSMGWVTASFIFQRYFSKQLSFILSTTLFFMVMYWGSGVPWGIVQNPLCDFAQPIIVFFNLWKLYQYVPERCIFFGIIALPFMVELKAYKKIVLLTLFFFSYFFSVKQDSWDFFGQVYHWQSASLCEAVVHAREQGKNIIVGCEGKLSSVSQLEVLPADFILLCGAYYFYENGQYDNCAVCVQDCKVQMYQKQFLVPYVEQSQKDLFVQSCCQKQTGVSDYFFVGDTLFVPMICSDFYFGKKKFDTTRNKPILLFFTSHQMLCFHFIKNVLRNFIKKQKYILQLCIVYVSNEEWYVV